MMETGGGGNHYSDKKDMIDRKHCQRITKINLQYFSVDNFGKAVANGAACGQDDL